VKCGNYSGSQHASKLFIAVDMKTIAVLTDFSSRAEHAALFALFLAQKIKADVLLYNAFQVPSLESVGHHGGDYGEIKKSTDNKLSTLRGNLEAEIENKSLPATWLPSISYLCEEGEIANHIAELEEDDNIILIVLATHGIDKAQAFMMGDNCLQVIDSATVPLLIIPENCAIKNIEKFAFATDIVHNDMDYIQSLASLAKQFSAEILIANVNPHLPLTLEYSNAINAFKKEVTSKINYNQVYYRNIPNDNVKKGLNWLIENIKFDVLVMVHRKGDPFEFSFKPSITKKIADHVYIPLMVYPYPVSLVPSF